MANDRQSRQQSIRTRANELRLGAAAKRWLRGLPRIEMVEKHGKLCISADLPGVKKEDLTVEVNDDSVTIAGERRQERTTEERGYYQSERSYGTFYRSIPLPEGVAPESATAEFKDGVLQIEIPAPERRSHAHKLEIRG